MTNNYHLLLEEKEYLLDKLYTCDIELVSHYEKLLDDVNSKLEQLGE